jgi:hypothetical protein
MSTLDHLTKGRIAWNIVTGYLESASKGVGQAGQSSHDLRYDMADDFMEVVYKLWEGSWEDGAVVRDRARGVFTDPQKVHRVRHDGPHYQVDAIHLSEPSPQRTPVLYQAGASTRGRAFAARHAECVFLTTSEAPMVRAHVADIRRQAEANGRRGDDIAVIVAATIITGKTTREAQEKYEDIRGHLDVAGSLSVFSALAGVDFSKYDPDDPIEYMKTDANQSFLERVTILTKGRKMRIKDLTAFHPDSPTSGVFLIGSAKEVARQLVDFADETGIDGFNLIRTVEPGGLQAVVDLVVPELQTMGAYKTSYGSGALRNKLFGRGDRLSATHPGLRLAKAYAQEHPPLRP